MAAKIEVGASTYLINFAGGQGGSPYTGYATDFDINFVTLRTTVNTMIDEIKAVQGPNATLGVDILIYNDNIEHTPDPVSDGLLGIHSYLTQINAGTLEVEQGEALLGGQKVISSAQVILTPAAGAGTYYVALDINGFPILATSSGTEQLDIYSGVFNGTIFTSVTLLAEIFFDGDEYEGMRNRPTIAPTWTAKTYDQFNYRMLAVERLLAGLTTDGTGAAIGPHVHPDGTVGAPGHTFSTQQNLGFYRSAADTLSASTAGVLRLSLNTTALDLRIAGSAGTPSLIFVGDVNTGFFQPGADRLGASTAGNQCFELDAVGNLDLARNARVQGNEGTFRDLTDNAQATLEFTDADSWDIGNGTNQWHDHTANPADEEFAVPTDCDGTYHLLLEFEWEPGVDATNDTEIYIMLNGTTIGTHDIARCKRQIISGEEFANSCSTYAVLAATDIIRAVALVDTSAGSNMGLNEYRLSITKVA